MGGNWRKRWRYVGAYDDRFMLCAAAVEIGPGRETFWALWDREERALREHTRHVVPVFAGPEVSFGEDSVAVRSREVEIDLELGGGQAIECECPAGDGAFTWTRKLARRRRPRASSGSARREIPLRGRAVDDRSAGYHARRTSWLWSAGVGEAADGRPVAWNLVSGINDPPTSSERAIWVDGTPAEPAPVTFDGLDSIAFEDGSVLGFEAEAARGAQRGRAAALRLGLRGAVRLVHRVARRARARERVGSDGAPRCPLVREGQAQAEAQGEEAVGGRAQAEPRLRDLEREDLEKVAKASYARFGEVGLTDRAATLAYYGFLSLFPGLIVAVSLLALLGSYPETYESIIETLRDAAPGTAVDTIDSALKQVLRGGGAGSLLGFGLLFSLRHRFGRGRRGDPGARGDQRHPALGDVRPQQPDPALADPGADGPVPGRLRGAAGRRAALRLDLRGGGPR